MREKQITSNSSEETIKIAKKIAENINKKSVIILTGELGSGKTKFTEGFLTYFNLQDEISSPTFNIVNEYKTEHQNIFHFDVYRLESEDEFYEIGGEEYFEKGICIIEWGELIKDALPSEFLHIIFSKDDNDLDKRVLTIKAYGEQYEKLLDII